jgi:hypothetical protein
LTPCTAVSRAETGSAAQALADIAAQSNNIPLTRRNPAGSEREMKRPIVSDCI